MVVLFASANLCGQTQAINPVAKAVHPAPEDQLVLQRMLPAGQLGHRDLIAERLEHQRANDVRQMGSGLAPVDRMRPQERPSLWRYIVSRLRRSPRRRLTIKRKIFLCSGACWVQALLLRRCRSRLPYLHMSGRMKARQAVRSRIFIGAHVLIRSTARFAQSVH